MVNRGPTIRVPSVQPIHIIISQNDKLMSLKRGKNEFQVMNRMLQKAMADDSIEMSAKLIYSFLNFYGLQCTINECTT